MDENRLISAISWSDMILNYSYIINQSFEIEKNNLTYYPKNTNFHLQDNHRYKC